MIDLLDDFGLSESDSDGEEDEGVSAYLGSGRLDLEEVQALERVVGSERLASDGGEVAHSGVASALLDSTDEERMEEDFLGENNH